MITGDSEDPNYFELVQGKMKPKGSVLPHPIDWKGRHDTIGKEVEDPNIRVATLNEVDPLDYDYKFKTKDGRRRKLTNKQKLKAQYMLQGYTQRQAALKAGYSVMTANKQVMKNQRTLVSFFEGVRGRFSKLGVDEDFVAEKIREWMTANKVVVTRTGEMEVPDYKTQIEAYDRFQKLVEPGKDSDKGKKREIKLTEWIQGDEKEHD